MEQANSTFQSFLRRLTNVSGHNRLLFLPRLHAEQLLDVQALSFLNGTTAFSMVNALIAGKQANLCPVLDSRLESSNKASDTIKKIHRADLFFFDEKGTHDLHVGWPFVQGKLLDGTLIRCPLLFFPVQLEQQQSNWVLRLRKDAGITFNKTFLLSYAQGNSVVPQEDLLDFSFDDWDSDSTVFRTQLYQLLKDKLEVNFNTDLFSDELRVFEDVAKAEFETTHSMGLLKLQQQAVLGIFPQAGSQLVPDYLSLLQNTHTTTLDHFFESRALPGASTHGLKEESIFTPLETDEWQEHAVRQVKAGRSIVVQGPPGTGKSQLIGNLICDAMATGKRVLLVCQKRVALDVVYGRLSKLGLQGFIGLVHDFRNDRKQIYTTIASQIDSIEDFKRLNRGIDAIQQERAFVQAGRMIDTCVEELEDYRNALYHEGECGLSAKELYLTCNPNAPTINLQQEYSFFDFRNLPALVALVERYARFAKKLEDENYPWKHRVSFARTDFAEIHRRTEVIGSILRMKNALAEKTEKWFGVPLSLHQGEALQANSNNLHELISLVSKQRVFEYLQAMGNEREEETNALWFDNQRLLCMNCFGGEGLERSLPGEQLGKFQLVLQRRMDARKRSFIRLLQWEWFSEDKFWLKRVLVANGLTYSRKDLMKLEARLDNRLNFEHHVTAMRNKDWLTNMPVGLDAAQWALWFDDQKKAIRAKLLLNTVRQVSINPTKFNHHDFVSLLAELAMAVSEIPMQRAGWEQFISPFQIRLLLQDSSHQEKLQESLINDFEDLVLFDEMKQGLSANERSVIDKLFDSVKQWNEDALVQLLQNSIRLKWLQHLEAKYPVLRLVSSQRFVELEKSLQLAVQEKQRLTKELLLLRLRERAYEHINYNRLNNAVTYRDLHHQVSKRKKIWPLRKTLSIFKDELFNLMPCWMASPESVSALFPLEQFFDLVIFDEASQCFAERGIPAMARGKQVVVAGDSQQLQPSDLYQARWTEQEDSSPDVEVDSLLALSERYLPTVYLQGHYRSKSNELIDFSNRYFYKGRLKMLPDAAHFSSNEPAIDFVRVNGIWEKQRNAIEASEVAKLVMWWHLNHPAKEVGVITFNAPQQQLVLDSIEELFADSNRTIPETLLVKNIENVQGDERDVIIFSIGYAPDKKGNISLQFGSLNVSGGENRLNVAVSRAREKIVVLCSLEPEHLQTDDLKNEGPKLFKKYLQYAKAISEKRLSKPEKMQSEYKSSWYLSSKLVSDDLVPTQLPFADLISTENARLILTDDEHYRFSLSVKSAHAYTPAFLEKKGWRFARLSSRNYWHNKPSFMIDIKRLLS